MCTMFEKATRGILRCGLAATMVLGAGGIARADVITLTDGNSSAIIDTAGTTTGLVNWTVDGVNKLFDQWFGFRYQDNDWLAGPNGNTVQGPLDALGTPTIAGTTNTAILAYNNGQIAVSVTFVLTGDAPGSEQSMIDENITITNLMNDKFLLGANDLHFFQYSDFDLCGPGSSDSVNIGYTGATQTSFCNSIASETTITPHAGNQEWPAEGGPGYQAGSPADVSLSALHGVDLDNTGSFSGGDAAWAFEWNLPLSPAGGGYDTFTIHKTMALAPVPEPMSLVLLGAGLLGVGRAIRRRSVSAPVA